MKKVITVVLAAMMIFCGLHVVAAEETIEVATSEEEIIEQEVAEAPAEEAPAAEEPVAEEPAAEEPAAEEPAPEPVAPEAPAADPAPEAPAEKPAEPAPAAEPVKEAAKEAVPEEPAEKPAEAAPAAEPVQEPAQEAPVAEPAPAAPAAEPVKETVAEEPAAVETEEAPAAEEAPASFTGTLAVRYSQNPVEIGTTTFFRAAVHNENMAYTLQWELETETGWIAISGANAAVYTFTVAEPAGTYNYRVVLTAEDGTVLTAEVALTVVEPETEEPAAEIPAEEELEAEEPAEEIPAEVKEPETETAEFEEIEDYETALGLPAVAAEQQELPDNATLIGEILDELNANRRIQIYITGENEEIKFGDKVTLYSVLVGYEDCEYDIQWQVSPDDKNYTDVAGEVGSNYTFVVTEDNYMNYWRVAVTITAVNIPDSMI